MCFNHTPCNQRPRTQGRRDIKRTYVCIPAFQVFYVFLCPPTELFHLPTRPTRSTTSTSIAAQRATVGHGDGERGPARVISASRTVVVPFAEDNVITIVDARRSPEAVRGRDAHPVRHNGRQAHGSGEFLRHREQVAGRRLQGPPERCHRQPAQSHTV